MAYVKALFNALLVALSLGALAGVAAFLSAAFAGGAHDPSLAVYEDAVATGLHCAAVALLVLVPVIVIRVRSLRRRARAVHAEPSGTP